MKKWANTANTAIAGIIAAGGVNAQTQDIGYNVKSGAYPDAAVPTLDASVIVQLRKEELDAYKAMRSATASGNNLTEAKRQELMIEGAKPKGLAQFTHLDGSLLARYAETAMKGQPGGGRLTNCTYAVFTKAGNYDSEARDSSRNWVNVANPDPKCNTKITVNTFQALAALNAKIGAEVAEANKGRYSLSSIMEPDTGKKTAVQLCQADAFTDPKDCKVQSR